MSKRIRLTIMAITCFVIIGLIILNTKTANKIITYQSNKLGIQFIYADRNDLGQKISVKESGDTVYVYQDDTKPEDGQYVRVFTKNKKDTLQASVEARFLENIDPQDCYVRTGMDGRGTLPKTGWAIIISYPITDDANNAWLENAKKCPSEYSLSDGLSYFWTDNESSEKFVFFSLGQYILPGSENDLSWHTSVQFLK